MAGGVEGVNLVEPVFTNLAAVARFFTALVVLLPSLAYAQVDFSRMARSTSTILMPRELLTSLKDYSPETMRFVVLTIAMLSILLQRYVLPGGDALSSLTALQARDHSEGWTLC